MIRAVSRSNRWEKIIGRCRVYLPVKPGAIQLMMIPARATVIPTALVKSPPDQQGDGLQAKDSAEGPDNLPVDVVGRLMVDDRESQREQAGCGEERGQVAVKGGREGVGHVEHNGHVDE